MQLGGPRQSQPHYTWAKVGIFTSRHICPADHASAIFFIRAAAPAATVPAVAKAKGYGINYINTIPTITAAISVVTTLIYARSSDIIFRGARWLPIVFSGTVNIFINTCLTVWNILRWSQAGVFSHDGLQRRHQRPDSSPGRMRSVPRTTRSARS